LPARPTQQTSRAETARPLVAEAPARWPAAGVEPPGLGGATLGLASGHTTWLDDNAAGWGWFYATPGGDSEFPRGERGRVSGPRNRMNLLTIPHHEVGPLPGYVHGENAVRIDTLAAGTRRTPAAALDGADVDWLFALADLNWAGPRKRR